MIDLNKAKKKQIKKQLNTKINKDIYEKFDKFCKQNEIIKSRLLEELIKKILKEKKWQ